MMPKSAQKINILITLIVLLMVVVLYLYILLRQQYEKIDAFIPQAKELLDENESLRQMIKEQYVLLEQYENLTAPDKGVQSSPATNPDIQSDTISAIPSDLNFKDLNRP